MATVYVQEIRKLNSADLLTVFTALENGHEHLAWPAGKTFEHLVLRAFEIAGAEVTWPYSVKAAGTEVEQIDGAIRTSRVTSLVESKHYAGNLDIAPIAKIRNQLLRRPPGVMASVFVMHGFTEPAKILTRYSSPVNVLLWERDEVSTFLTDATANTDRPIDALHQKYKYAVEQAMPDYNIKAGY
jgi:hypothetical protein